MGYCKRSVGETFTDCANTVNPNTHFPYNYSAISVLYKHITWRIHVAVYINPASVSGDCLEFKNVAIGYDLRICHDAKILSVI
jgi:hypothetical protein